MHTAHLDEARKIVWDTVLSLEKAIVQKDAAAFERLLSDDFIGAVPTGESFTKAGYISHHCHPGFGITALTGDDINAATIRFYDNTAVVTHRVHALFKLPTGAILENDVQRIEVLVKKNNEWQLVGGQGTQVRPPNQPMQTPPQ